MSCCIIQSVTKRKDNLLLLRLPLASIDAGITPDVSGNYHNGNVTGSNIEIVSGPLSGSAFQKFYAIDDLVTVPQSEALDVHGPGKSYTYCMWARQYTTNAAVAAAMSGASGGATPFLMEKLGSSSKYVSILLVPKTGSSTTITSVDSGGELPSGTWKHIAFVRDAYSDKGRLYFNGILNKEDTVSGSNDYNVSTSGGGLYIGGLPSWGQSYQWSRDNYQAALSDVRIYTKALTADEILAIYNGTM